MKRLFSTILALFLLCGLALAHEGERPIMGKVTAISANSITVETAAKEPKTVTVAITAQTKFVKSGAAASVKGSRPKRRSTTESAICEAGTR